MSKNRILWLLLLISICASAYGSSDKIDRQREVIASLEKQLANGDKQIATLRKNRAATEQKVATLARQIETRNQLLTAQRREEAQIRKEIKELDVNTIKHNMEIAHHRQRYGELVREAYRSYQGQSTLSYLFTAEDFLDMARKVSNMRAVAILREEYIDRIDSLTTQLGKERKELEVKQRELTKIVQSLEQQRTRLQRDVNSAKANIKSMSDKEKKELRESELRKRQLDSAVKELQKLIQNNKAGASFSAKTSNLRLPVVGGSVKLYKDNMAEVVGPVGAKVVSIYDGKVVDIRRNRITGKIDIYIAHGEYITSYSGLSSVSVEKDDIVVRNGVVGVIGESIDIITLQSEHKIVFGIYPPAGKARMTAKSVFSK